MNSEILLREIKKAAYLEGDFTTRAGNKTTYYIDKYLFETRPEILEPLCSALAALFPPSDHFDRIAAPELGAVSLAAVLSIKLNKPFIIIKKQSKGYGTQKYIEGYFQAHDRMVLIEDVITTGGTALKSYDILTEHHVKVTHVIGVLDREEGGMESLSQKGVLVRALFSKTDLMQC